MELIGAGTLLTPQQRAMAFLIERLTPPQREIAALLADGLTRSDIAERLNIAPKRVMKQVQAVMTNLGLQTPTQIASVLAAYEITLLCDPGATGGSGGA